MLKDITRGQYLPTGSPVHKIDPRIKILIVVIYMIAVFMINNFLMYLPIFIGIIIVCIIARIPVSYILKGLKPLRMIIILTFLINALATPGEEIFRVWILSFTQEGINRAIFMAVRLILLVVGTSLLTLTTSPMELTLGLEAMFSPLKGIGFPAHEIAMMLTIALRFIPTLIDETDKIMKAQKSRGADFESGNIINRAKNLVPLLVPLFISAFRRADELAMAMEARCYRGGENRTRMRQLKISKGDYVASGVFIVYFAAIILIRIW